MDSKEKQMKKQVASTERETNEKQVASTERERRERERENEKKKKVQSGLFVAYLRSKIRTFRLLI